MPIALTETDMKGNIEMECATEKEHSQSWTGHTKCASIGVGGGAVGAIETQTSLSTSSEVRLSI